MQKLDFFTPLIYTTSSKPIRSALIETIDSYFYLGGKKAYVIQGRTKNGREKVILLESSCSLLEKVRKIASYFTVIVPLLMVIAKAILRLKHSFKVIDPRQKLEKGIDISSNIVAKLQKLIPKIIKTEDDKDIEWLQKYKNLVFRLKGTPNFVYKISAPYLWQGREAANAKAMIEERFANMVKAKKISLLNNLSLLIIPHAKKFDIEVAGIKYTFIAEEFLDFDPDKRVQEKLYKKYSTQMNETARQLAVFVAKTGFNDVAWRNIPILKEAEEFQCSRRVALIDLEHMDSSGDGFLGCSNGSRGLIFCVDEAQVDIVFQEACRQGLTITREQIAHVKKNR